MPLSYREIIVLNLREAIKKRDKAKNEHDINYWDYIKGQLLEDLRDYERRGRWKREPHDKTFEKYRPMRRMSHLDIDEIIRRFFNNEWF